MNEPASRLFAKRKVQQRSEGRRRSLALLEPGTCQREAAALHGVTPFAKEFFSGCVALRLRAPAGSEA